MTHDNFSSISPMKPLAMFATMIAAMIEPTVDPALTENFVKYAMTQGGLFMLVIVLGWSYRRDFIRMADQRSERIQVLTDIVAAATAAQTKTADALAQSIAGAAAQAQSLQQALSLLTELKVSLAGRRATDS
jgi:hypothetical protein